MAATRRKAAHSPLVPEPAGSPPDEAIVHALLELDFDVDPFAPGEFNSTPYGKGVAAHSVSYGRRWLARHALSPRWRSYALFSGTSENPLAVVGTLACLHR